MKRLFSLLLSAVLLFALIPAAAAAPSQEPEDPAEYYVIGEEENTFDGLYKRMCSSLDLKKHPLPEADTDLDPMTKDGEYEHIYVLKDDETSYEYIGHVLSRHDKPKYIVWCWVGFHKDGSLIGMDVYYTLEGKYLGNIQHDYSAGTSTSSSRCPYFIPGEPLNKE